MRSSYSGFVSRLILAVLFSGVFTASVLAHVGSSASSGSSSGSSASSASSGSSSPSSASSGSSSGSSGSSSSGSSSGSSGSSSGAGHNNVNIPLAPNAPVYNEVDSSIKSITRGAEPAIDECDNRDFRCIADVLDNYAAALREIAPQLPPAMRNLPDIVARAARRVRVARTRQEAIQAVKVAIDAVRKSIALLKADDPVALNRATRAGSFVAETLQVADNKLEKAVGL